MAHAAVAEDLLAAFAPFLPVAHDVKREDRAEFLDRQREVAANPVEFSNEHLRLVRDGDAARIRDGLGRLADERRVREALRGDEHRCHLLDVGLAEEVTALRLELALHLAGDRRIDHNRILRRTEHAVVKGLAGNDVADRLADIRAAFDVGRRVTGADAVGRLARAVGGADQSHAACGKDDRHIALLHQFLRPREGDGRHPVDGACRSSRPPRRIVQYLGHPRDALCCGGVGADDDRAARLERDEDLVDGGRGGVGRRHDRRHHTERFGDLDDAPGLVPGDDADSLHRLDEVVDRFRGEQVLLDLVFVDAKPCLVHSQTGKRLGVGGGGVGDGGDDGVDLFLGELGEFEPGLLGPSGERARLGNGGEVAIGLGADGGVCHRAAMRPWGGCVPLRHAGGG